MAPVAAADAAPVQHHAGAGSLERDGRTVAWSDTGGEGPVLVLLHGWCCDRLDWDAVTETLAADFRLVAVDLAGHGQSDPVPTPSMEALAGDVAAVIEHLGLTDAILVGHSMGGPVALETMILARDRCSGLIGVDTFTDKNMYARRTPEEIAARCAPVAADLAGYFEALIPLIVLADTDNLDLRGRLAGRATSFEPSWAADMMAALLAWDLDSRWTLFRGEATTLNATRLEPLLDPFPHRPGLKVIGLADTGHFPMLETPQAFAQALKTSALAARG